MHKIVWLFKILTFLICFPCLHAMKNAAGQPINQINLPVESINHEEDKENQRQIYHAKLSNSSDKILVYKHMSGPRQGDKEGVFYAANQKNNGSVEYTPMPLYPELAENCFFVLSSAFKEQVKKFN